MQQGFMDTSAWVEVVLDSDTVILEMGQDAEWVSTNRPGTIKTECNTFRTIYVIIKLLQGKLASITTT